jgi:transposase
MTACARIGSGCAAAAGCCRLGNPVELRLTPGQAHDLACAEPLIENADPDALIGDKAYDADPFVETLTQRGITPVIPSKANRKTKRAAISRSTANVTSSNASSINSSTSVHRHTRAVGRRYHPAQLNTGPRLAVYGGRFCRHFKAHFESRTASSNLSPSIPRDSKSQ